MTSPSLLARLARSALRTRVSIPATLLAFALAASAVGCLGNPAGPVRRGPGLDGERWLLFIGNSHTYVENVPYLVQEIARQGGDLSIRTSSVSEPNFSLEDHWYTGQAAHALRAYTWDYVVMQQGPSATGENPWHLSYWSQQFAPLIRAAEAEPVLYQIWPSDFRRFDAAGTLSAYSAAAASVNGILAPAGDGFTAALEISPTMGVYAGDGTHASVRGAYVAALTIVGRITEIDLLMLPPVIPGRREDELVVRALQQAAVTALGRSPARP